ncbi:SDR family oxidoreductase [Acidisoma cellulosilytica]|uniref:SDR family oxidoreductase n=1 Tax=Acidisoma cellulosilyticum TaxID=2802395 RepID=A0A963Z4D7_9PROT|nr:SDR family oxidoreductase [Acidisoma cellulosilyticum]MCB8882604.1 SDR family oxidoreductase [Acidisoma cellulosilyticum]
MTLPADQSRGSVLVFGGRGVVGCAALQLFETLPQWRVTGLARRPPGFETQAEWLSIDLTDSADCTRRLAPRVGDVTHIVYCALYEERDLVGGWTERRQIDLNLAMLKNAIAPFMTAASALRHVTLLQGTKAYGVHHGPYKMPAKESDPRFIASNFYYEQEDFLREVLTEGRGYTVLRPQIVCGFAIGNPMNAVTAIGTYAAICQELGQPFRFPGGAACFQEAVDSRLLARAILWAGQTPSCLGEIFNIANGDCFSWPTIWPGFAERFGLSVGQSHPFSLAATMADKGPIWDRIVKSHDLMPLAYDDIVHSWDFMDYLLRQGSTVPRHSLVSTIKARQHGFHDCVDTEAMFDEILGQLQDARVLPRRRGLSAGI